ncbi:ABC-three component system protein [Rhizobium grahamii]|uniref:ABC-three component systems C-terminal domain-containing protein n=1 Tax=Rhizobium grahamii CCGE 502 TaxID=990285 RepID=S3HC76_9HYPH|nr:ABC-three component system protein [Rhizobium grahamii]EPE96322.1 hypothetical protein RGCCGE502_20655 [Rhizobium grahamii CCGE 502]
MRELRKLVVANPAHPADIFTDRWPEDKSAQRLWRDDLIRLVRHLRTLRGREWDPQQLKNEFTQVIYGQIPKREPEEISALVIDRIVNPIVDECGGDLMAVNHNLVQGMVFWLAEQCFIKWHHGVVAR